MAVQSELDPRAFQLIFPQTREAMGITNGSVVGVDPIFSQELVEVLTEKPLPHHRKRAIALSEVEGVQALDRLDLNNPPSGVDQESTVVLQAALREPFLRESSTKAMVEPLEEEIPVREKKIYTAKEAAERIEVDLSTIYQYAKELGVGFQQRKWTRWSFNEADIEAIITERKRRRQGRTERVRKLTDTRFKVKYQPEHIERLIAGLEAHTEMEHHRTYSLREASALLRSIGQEVGIEISHQFRQTLHQWAYLALAEAMETGKTDEFSPRAFAFRGKEGKLSLNLTPNDIGIILSAAVRLRDEVGNIGNAYSKARTNIMNLLKQQEKNISLTTAAEDILGSRWKTKRLEEMISSGELPLEDYSFLLANTIGIPPDLYEQLRPMWQARLEEMRREKITTLHPRRQLQLAREEKSASSMKALLKEILGPQKGRHVAETSFYLAEKLAPHGIKIKLAPSYRGVSYYCYADKDDAEKLRAFAQQPEAQSIIDRARQILEEGFTTIGEYQEYYPQGSIISLTDGLRLLDVPLNSRTINKGKEKIISALASLGLTVREQSLGRDSKTGRERKGCCLDLGSLIKKWEELPKSQNLEAILILAGIEIKKPAPSILYKQGRLMSLTEFLKQAGFGRVGNQRVRGTAELLRSNGMQIFSLHNGHYLDRNEFEQNLQTTMSLKGEIEELLAKPVLRKRKSAAK